MRCGLLVGVLAGLACGGDGLERREQPMGPGATPSAPVGAAPVPVTPGPAESTPDPLPPQPPAPPPPAPLAPRVPATAPQFEPTQCSRTEYRQDGSLLQWEVLGADGLVREHHWFFADGREGSSYLQQVEAGRVVVRDDFSGNVRQQRREWHYGERGELLRLVGVQGMGGGRSVVEYVYDAQGRPVHEDSYSEGLLLSRKSYLYTDGLLVRVETRDMDNPYGPGYLRGLTTYTHHPNGQVKHSESWWDSFMGLRWGASADFDEAGRLIASESYFDDHSSRTEQGYDGQGRLSRRVTLSSGSRSRELREETFEYDAAGRLVLRPLVRERTEEPGMLDERVTSTRETWRSTYGALGQLVLLAVDLDDDGVPEGRRHFTYDEAGRLVEERLEGTAPPMESGRVVYTHGCQG